MTDQIKKLLAYQAADAAVDEAEKKVKTSKARKTANLMKQRYELAVEERKKLIASRDEAETLVASMAAEIDKLASLADVDRAKDAPEDVDALKKLLAEIDKISQNLKKQFNKSENGFN